MSKVDFNELELKKEFEPAIVKIGENEVEVKQYLPIERKMSLINIVVRESIDPLTNLIDKIMADTLFEIYLIMSYTNIDFPKATKFEAYDLFEQNGAMVEIISAIPRDEYDYLVEKLDEAIVDYDKFRNTFAGMLNQFITALPVAMEIINDQLEDFNLENFKNIAGVINEIGGSPDAVVEMINGGQK